MLAEYHATAKQRMSAGLGVARGLGMGPVGRIRLAARFESVARVGWHAQLGAWGELLAARAVAPIVGEVEANPEQDDVALILPYYPGRDRLWPTTELRDAMPGTEHWIEHPLDTGGDSLYLFSIGDSLTIRLPDGAKVELRELRVRPRRPDQRLIVGSLWVDIASGSLVRAAYRPSAPIDLWPFMEHDIGRNDRDHVKKFGPFTGTIREIIVEHGLYEGRFWLPRVRIAEGEGTAKGGRITLSIEQSFTYQRVRAYEAGAVRQQAEPDVDVDPITGRVRRPKWRGVEHRTRRCRPHGDSTSAQWSADSLLRDDRLSIMTAEGVRFRVLAPCNLEDLVNSPLLPPSIYSPSEELFTERDLSVLRKDVEHALDLSSQAAWSPRPRTITFGVERGLLRYNRVEGLSVGVLAERELGNGYTTSATARFGLADHQPNAELRLQRSNVKDDVQATVYRRLDAANDWSNPLALGASAVAAVFGRDDGFYYRSLGAEIAGTHRPSTEGATIGWRLFAERHDSAVVETQRSLANTINGARFAPNIAAREGLFAGGAITLGIAAGLDPTRTRASSTLRLEAAGGEASYARGALEASVARGLGRGVQTIITGAAGYTAGTVPTQRLWYLGGAQTVHGHAAGAASGDAFWMARGELSKGSPLLRPAVFADVGWAGSRTDWARSPQRISGAGVGFSAVDGLVRFDVSRGIEGARKWRVDLYIDAR